MRRIEKALVCTLLLGIVGTAAWVLELERQAEEASRVHVEPTVKAASVFDSLPPVQNQLDNSIGDQPERVERATLEHARARELELPGADDGLVTRVTVETPSFHIDRKYRSMEGPFASYEVALREDAHERELWWWKGARIVVVDPEGEDLGSEFMCHLNVDVDSKTRRQAFSVVEPSSRLLTMTQGEMRFRLPPGKAVPVASDEVWKIMFQVLNHNRSPISVNVRQRLELYFVRDADLFRPLDALEWYGQSIWVPLSDPEGKGAAADREACPCCAPLERALEATNNVAAARRQDAAGRPTVGHWVVPPGKSLWSFPLSSEAGFFSSHERQLFAAWTHVHPFARRVQVVAHDDDCASHVVAETTIENRKDGKTGLVAINSPYSEQGIALPRTTSYELAVEYDNDSGRASDSMTSMGLFASRRHEFVRPAWASRARGNEKVHESCGLGPDGKPLKH